jgi:hypothetical protein
MLGKNPNTIASMAIFLAAEKEGFGGVKKNQFINSVCDASKIAAKTLKNNRTKLNGSETKLGF